MHARARASSVAVVAHRLVQAGQVMLRQVVKDQIVVLVKEEVLVFTATSSAGGRPGLLLQGD